MLPLAAAGLIGGGISSAVGLFQRGSANRWLKNNQMPEETIPRELLENQGIANNMANSGLPAEQYNNAMKRIQRQQMNALHAAGDRRGVLSSLAGITGAGNDAMSDVEAQDAAARTQNQKLAMGVNSEVAGVKRDLFDKNKREKYMREWTYNMGKLGSGNQNLMGGIDKMLAGGAGLFGGGGSRSRMGGGLSGGALAGAMAGY
jgi:hypothetical protein